MKLRLTLITLALAGLADAGQATTCKNGATNYPTCTLPTTTKPDPAPATLVTVQVTPTQTAAPVTAAADLTASQVSALRAQQEAAANAAASAKAAGGQGGNAAGGQGGNASSAGGTAALTDQSQSNSKAWALSLGLPQPMQLAAMAGVGCPTPDITQSSRYGLWGAAAWADAKTNTDACVLMAGYSHYLAMCQFKSAATLLGRIMSKRLDGFTPPEPTGIADMSPQECAEFRNPPPPRPVVMVLPPPVAHPAPPAPERVVSLAADALFDFDKDTLKPSGKAKLDDLAAKLRGEPANIVIVGHTDSRGSDAYNDRLSMRRANAVRAHLALRGIDLTRMIALGKGKREPTCTERTEACHAENRRVDVRITVPAASPRLTALAG